MNLATTPRPDDIILRLPAVRARTGLSRSMIYRKIADRSFPQSIKISNRCVGWYESQIGRWVENPIAYRHEAEAADRGQS